MPAYEQSAYEPSEETVEMIDQTEMHPYEDFVVYLRRYTKQKPEVVAFACLGLGFILGWKLKPW